MINVILGLVSNLSAELKIRESFLAGYESEGTRFQGNILIKEYVSNIPGLFEFAHKNGYNLITMNSGVLQNSINMSSEYYGKGIQGVFPNGSNLFQNDVYDIADLNHAVICSAGKDQNQTGIDCEFFDIDPNSSESVIADIRQEGTIYNISQINRVSSSLLKLKLSGVPDVSVIGIAGREGGHGIPLLFTGVAGTDISPLPSNGIINTYTAIGEEIYISFNSESGTIGNWQNVSGGTIHFGSDDVTRAFIRTESYNIFYQNYGVKLNGILGFSSSPDGEYQIADYYNSDNYGDKFAIVKPLGTGSYLGGGTARIDTESYSTPYIAGKLAYIKNYLNCSWWEARYRMRMTASSGGIYVANNGYGKPNVSNAIAFDGEIPADPYDTLGEISEISIVRSRNKAKVTAGKVDNATRYELYHDNVLVNVISGLMNSETYLIGNNINLNRHFPGDSNKFNYKALRNGSDTGLSDTVTLNYPKMKSIRIK